MIPKCGCGHYLDEHDEDTAFGGFACTVCDCDEYMEDA
jgi:hypothetical protein